MRLRAGLRYGLSLLIVTVPCSYLLWQWQHLDEPVLEGLSYKSIDAQLSSNNNPVFWTYAIWILVVFGAMSYAVKLVDWLLARLFPNHPSH